MLLPATNVTAPPKPQPDPPPTLPRPQFPGGPPTPPIIIPNPERGQPAIA